MSADDGKLELALELREEDRIGLLRAEGDIDLAVADELEAALRSAAEEERSVVLDLSAVPFLDSSGLRVVLVAVSELQDRIAVVITPGSPVSRLVELAEATERIRSHPSEEEALAAVGAGGPQDGG